MRLVLWDIDHTLVEIENLQYDLYARALPVTFGKQSVWLPDMTGRTDRDNSVEYLLAHGLVPTEENLVQFWRTLADQFDRVLTDPPRRAYPKAGAAAALEVLAATPGVYQSVLTGNLRTLAERKLSPFGLEANLDFAIGGYGEDSVKRADLVESARARLYAERGVTAELRNTVLLGDTPLDVEAALVSGARIVGVATGRFSVDELREAGADVVLPDLVDTPAVTRAVLAAAQ